jgi:hypothetical protein
MKKSVKKAVKKKTKKVAKKTASTVQDMSFSEELESLPANHRRFVLAYLKNGCNAVKAYRNVYECSEESAQANAYRMMANDGILKAVRSELNSLLSTDKIEIESLVSRNLLSVLAASAGDYLDDSGDVDSEQIKDQNPFAVAGYSKRIKQTDSGTEIAVNFKLADKLKAAELALKYLGIIKDTGSVVIINAPQGLDAL